MPSEKKTLFLLDAYALIYRAHFAFTKNPRINSKGINTGVPLGFTNSLLEIIQKKKPTHIGVAFDTAKPTFRSDMYTEYKANRQETPEDIVVGAPLVQDIVKGFNIPILELDGYEADDIIGTLAGKAAKLGFEVYMMTPDKDYGQCVEENVYLYKPSFAGNSVEVLGVSEVLKKWDVERVNQVIDMLGLQGDSVDNIPGVPGVGPKTASKLLREFGSVEELLKNTDQLKGKLKENLETYSEQALLSKELAKIKTDVPIAFEEKELEFTGWDEPKLKGIFEELEFRTIAKRLFGEPESGQQMSMFSNVEVEENNNELEITQKHKKTLYTTLHNYHLIDDDKMIDRLIGHLELQDEFCFDTETTGVDAIEAEIVGISFSYYKKEAYYVPVSSDKEEATKRLNRFKGVLENDKIMKIGQNIKYDVLVLKKYGIQVSGPLYDTMIAHYLIEPEGKHNMDVLAENYLNYIPVSIETLIGKKGKNQGNMRNLKPEEVVDYASEDADITLQLKHKIEPLIQENKFEDLLKKVELPLVSVLADMEFEGVRIDEQALSQMSGELQEESIKAQDEIYEIAGTEFNIASPKQLGEILFDKLKLVEKPKKTKSGQYATGEEILSKLANEHEIASKILEFREYQKLKSTYVDALPNMVSSRDGRIHTDYRQTIAATGRLSSINPNLQNIPIRTEKGRLIRKAFVPRDKDFTLMSADYSQIELRIMASFSEDEQMISAFREGRDIHTTTAAKVFKVDAESVDPGMRRKAKEVNFGIIYGISAYGLSQNLNIPRAEASEIIEAYFKEFPAVKKYMDDTINTAKEKEYAETILGRKRYLRDINSKNYTTRGFAERNAINAPIQGSAADMIKVAMIQIHDWMKKEKLESKMIMQVHDELVFDVKKGEESVLEEKVKDLMKSAIELKVPMEVEIGFGENWLQAH
ncbi:MAG: DNA polymerase I [Bacteroidota bacterium]